MYVVLNDGFHDDKHMVHSYKVKIHGLDPLWGAIYSIVAQELQFFKLCLEEQRKLIKIKLQKRGQYRKRYRLLYEYQITNSRKFERVFE